MKYEPLMNPLWGEKNLCTLEKNMDYHINFFRKKYFPVFDRLSWAFLSICSIHSGC